MSELDVSKIRVLLGVSDSVEVILNTSSGFMDEELSGEEAAHAWDDFVDLYDMNVCGYNYRGDQEYCLALEYRHPMDDDWDRMVFRGYVAE